MMEKENDIISNMLLDDHEQVVFCSDKKSGLKSIIAIHDTTLGPALGGCRMWVYSSERTALMDALRLSRGMSYKAAISGLNLGGGKAIIIGDSNQIKNEKLMRRFGRFVNNLGGKYITAEDVGMTTRDMEYVHMETPHVVGVPEHLGGSGDPSPITAHGVLVGMKAAVKHQYGSDDLSGKRIGLQGLGHVGEYLLELLLKEKALVTVTDIDENKCAQISKRYNVDVVKPSEIYEQEMDVFAPCALGAILNNETIEKLRCKVIAGSANNQLADEMYHGNLLKDEGILYAPDFLINAGGLINVYSEMQGYNRNHVMAMIDNIYNVSSSIFKRAQTENISTAVIAKQMAEERIQNIKEIKQGL